jgi:hypothetical protein
MAMDSTAVGMTAELRDELASNDQAALLPVDPRSVPCRFSTLKQFARSPAHYHYAVQRGYDETAAMRLGSGVHAQLFDQPFRVFSGRRAGKEWAAFKADGEGLILNDKEHAEASVIVASLRAHTTAMRLLFTDTKIETRIDWDWNGRAFRSTPDAAGFRHCVDLKCLRSSEPERAVWQSRNMHYHAQAALYRRALNSKGASIKESYLVIVESKPPHPVTVMRFTDTALEAGDRACALWNERRRECEDSGVYPGYVQTIVDLDVPAELDDFQFADDEQAGES